jgi:hypothetical protein
MAVSCIAARCPILGFEMGIYAVEALAPGQRPGEGDMDDFIARIGDNAAGIGVDTLEKVVVAVGVRNEHKTSRQMK